MNVSGKARVREALEKLHFYQVVFGQRPVSKESFAACFISGAKEGDANQAVASLRPTIGKSYRIASDVYRIFTLAAILWLLISYCTDLGEFRLFNGTIRFDYIIPALFGTVASFVSAFILPSKFKVAADDVARVVGTSWSAKESRRHLDVDDIDWAGRRAGLFTIVWLVLGIVAVTTLYSMGFVPPSVATSKYPVWSWIVGQLVGACITTPTLGAIFFVFALDAARAKKEIRDLQKRAQDMSLTLAEYEESQKYIEGISRATNASLLVLSIIALYSAVSYVVWLFMSDIYAHRSYSFDKNIIFIAFDTVLSVSVNKESSLFVLFTYLAMVVNDAADDVCTEVYLWPTNERGGDGSDMLEAGAKDLLVDRRLRMVEIIAKATTFTGPKQRKHRKGGSPLRRLIAPKAGGIAFRVLGVRWTSSSVLALLLSIFTSIIGAYAQRYGAR